MLDRDEHTLSVGNTPTNAQMPSGANLSNGIKKISGQKELWASPWKRMLKIVQLRSMKVIQERAGHALTGSFTLDVYGGQPEWEPNVEAAQKAGAAIEQAIKDAEKSERFVSLTAIQKKPLSATA